MSRATSTASPLSPFVRGMLPCLVGTLLLLGCGKKESKPAAGKDRPLGAGSTTTVRGTKPSEEEAKQFADRLVSAVVDGGSHRGLLDMERMVEVATENLPISARERAGMRRGAASQFEGPANFIAQIRDQLGEGDYSLLRVHEVEGQRRVLCRMINAEGGLNYHDFVLEKTPSGQVKATDIYVFITGDFLSETFEQLFRNSLVHRGGLFGSGDRKLVENAERMARFMELAKTGRGREAMAVYRALPQNLQDEKAVMTGRLMATSNDEVAYERTLERYRELFPGSPALELVLADYYFLKKKYDRALQAVDALDEAVGGDPYLGQLRTGIHLEQGDVEAARTEIDRALEACPDMLGLYWSAVDVSIRSERFDRTLELLVLMDEQFEMEWNDLRGVEEFRPFVASPQFAEWEAHRRGF